MTTKFKPGSIDELVTEIYEDNFSHIEFMENMNGGDCDCAIHLTLQTILKYWEQFVVEKLQKNARRVGRVCG